MLTTRRDLILGGLCLAGLSAAAKPIRDALGGRSGAQSGGIAGPTAKDYVQDGLVAMWDGIENIGWGVHDANATKWKNLARDEYDLAVINGATFGNDHIICNQTNKPVACTDLNVVITPQYVEFVYDKTVSNAYAFSLHTKQSRGIIAFKNSGVTFASQGGSTYAIDLGGTTSCGSIGFDYSSRAKYRNGRPVSDGSVTEAWDGTTNRISIGGRFNNSTSVFKGKIFCIRIYDTSLSAAEIARNYAVDKARFNLP